MYNILVDTRRYRVKRRKNCKACVSGSVRYRIFVSLGLHCWMNFVSSNARKIKSCTGSYVFLRKVALTNQILAIVHKHIEDLVRKLFFVHIAKNHLIVVR